MTTSEVDRRSHRPLTVRRHEFNLRIAQELFPDSITRKFVATNVLDDISTTKSPVIAQVRDNLTTPQRLGWMRDTAVATVLRVGQLTRG